MDEKKQNPSGRTLRAILPLLGALVSMMVIGWLFVWLIGGEKNPESPTSNATYFALEKEYVRQTFTPLTVDEEVLLREKLALTADEEAIFRPEFETFANQYELAAAVHRRWLERLREPGGEITDGDQFVKLYLAENKKHRYLIERYSAIFARTLSPGRMPLVFILHEHIRAQRCAGKP